MVADLQISNEDIEEKFHNKMQMIEEDTLEKNVSKNAEILGLPYINLVNFSITSDAISVIDEAESKKTKIVCFFYNGEEFRLGVVDGVDVKEAEKIKIELKEKLHAKGKVYIISENSYLRALNVYKSIPKIKEITKGVNITAEDIAKFKDDSVGFKELGEKIKKVSLTDLITLVISNALQSRASDIHIEAEEKDVKIRFRIDGVLHDVVCIDKDIWSKIISRIKLMAALKMNIDNEPQDGRFTIYMEEGNIDVRVSALPTSYGESVVMRLLTSSAQGLTFDKLGLREKFYKILLKEVKKPNGMIIATGPTGSGKTTTLYSILKELNSPDKKLITLEDPIEYKLSGINQSQIDHSKGYDFVKGLRAILRQDPDVVMVGEIRDDETTDIAINAALTGHLVISTIHTNSASGAIPRFLSLNAKPYLLAPALNVVIGQRLVRILCNECKEEYKPNEDEIDEIKKTLAEIPENSGEKISKFEEMKFYKEKGCEKCQNLGYKGRIGIYEVMAISETLRKNILEAKNISEYDIYKMAQNEGMVSMRQDGLLKVIEGLTTLDEVFRVTK
ncbi:GspE/PulE family protein [Patescibacteria group bacterium]